MLIPMSEALINFTRQKLTLLAKTFFSNPVRSTENLEQSFLRTWKSRQATRNQFMEELRVWLEYSFVLY